MRLIQSALHNQVDELQTSVRNLSLQNRIVTESLKKQQTVPGTIQPAETPTKGPNTKQLQGDMNKALSELANSLIQTRGMLFMNHSSLPLNLFMNAILLAQRHQVECDNSVHFYLVCLLSIDLCIGQIPCLIFSIQIFISSSCQPRTTSVTAEFCLGHLSVALSVSLFQTTHSTQRN